MKFFTILHHWSLRLNWRVGFCVVVLGTATYIGPRVGLSVETIAALQQAAAAGLIAAMLSWTSHNGRRGGNGERGVGVIGVRKEDLPK